MISEAVLRDFRDEIFCGALILDPVRAAKSRKDIITERTENTSEVTETREALALPTPPYAG